MGFWKRLFGQGAAAPRPSQTPTGPPRNRVDALIDELIKAHPGKDIADIPNAEERLVQLRESALSRTEEIAWYHLYGVLAMRRGDRAEALHRFQVANDRFPDSGEIAFSLGQEYEVRGEPDRMLMLFDTCVFPAIPARYAMAQARYAYLWEAIDRGIRYVEPIFETYLELGIADDTFLYIRGLPFFSEWFDTYACLCRLAGRLDDAETKLKAAAGRLSGYDFGEEFVRLAGMTGRDRQGRLQSARKRLRFTEKHNMPTGMTRMEIAVLEAQQTHDEAAAKRLLDAVVLTDKDFPWLDDIRVLARWDIADRFGREDEKRTLRDDFFHRQPLMFEPHHLVTFNLIDCQEKLKPEYHSRRRRGTA